MAAAVFLTSNTRRTPYSLRRNLQHNCALHHTIVTHTVRFVRSPNVRADKHLKAQPVPSDITRLLSFQGGMETPDVPADLARASNKTNLGLNLDHLTCFMGGETLLAEPSIGMSGGRSSIYAWMARNEMTATRYFNLPPGQAFAIGTRIKV